MKLTLKQLAKLDEIFGKSTVDEFSDFQAVIDLYESEMRPKDAAPVMWRRRINTTDPSAIAFSDKDYVMASAFSRHTHYLTWADLLSIPFPADPTPEEKAKEEMEAAWKSKVVDPFGPYECFEAGFMAAKFPAEGGVKP